MEIISQMIVSHDVESAIRNKLIYSSATLLPNDWDDAFGKWFILAGEGDAKAQFNLGYCFDHGKGTEYDVVRAVEWYAKAATQNSARAFRNLGLIYMHRDFEIHNRHCELKQREHHTININLAKSVQYFAQGVALGDEISILASDVILTSRGMDEFEKGNIKGAKAIFQQLFDKGHECGRLGLIACDIEVDPRSFRQKFSPSPLDLANKNLLEFKVRNNSVWNVDAGFYLLIYEDGKPHIITASSDKKIPAKGMQRLTTRHLSEFDIVTLSHLYIKYEDSFFSDFSAKIDFKLGTSLNAVTTFRVGKESAMGCFVVTACTGSANNDTVNAFRQFRDHTLTRYAAGRHFITWYYREGPQLAACLKAQPLLLKFCGKVFDLIAKLL